MEGVGSSFEEVGTLRIQRLGDQLLGRECNGCCEFECCRGAGLPLECHRPLAKALIGRVEGDGGLGEGCS